MFVLNKKPYDLNTRMVQLVLDRTSVLIRARPYAYGPNTRTVQIRVWSGKVGQCFAAGRWFSPPIKLTTTI